MTVTLAKATDAPRVPAAILTETDILRDAADELERNDRMRMALRASDERLQRLCRQYDTASGTRGFQAHHLRHACIARGLMPVGDTRP